MVRRSALFATLALAPAIAGGAPVPGELMADANIGAFRVFYVLNNKMALTDESGMTLYVYAKDETEKSNCTATCAEQFPPLIANSGERGGFDSFTVFARPDGQLQWAFEGKPLYRSVRDQKPRDANGHGIDGVWSIVGFAAAHEM